MCQQNGYIGGCVRHREFIQHGKPRWLSLLIVQRQVSSKALSVYGCILDHSMLYRDATVLYDFVSKPSLRCMYLWPHHIVDYKFFTKC
jgi:hypothetical protein